jgi:hypothetical protein
MALIVTGCVTSPPAQEMSDARQTIAAAEEVDAARLSPVPLTDARRFLALAETQIRDRSFSMARTNAVRAKNRAIDALNESQETAQD